MKGFEKQLGHGPGSALSSNPTTLQKVQMQLKGWDLPISGLMSLHVGIAAMLCLCVSTQSTSGSDPSQVGRFKCH